MSSIHDMGEHTKRALDLLSFCLAGVTVASVQATVTIIAGLLSITWFVVRLWDRFKHGPSNND